ncbi:MAG: beta-aspartyl-peptidase [Syntrophomonadaceae bacterium]|nr:beta-aspartyl-peptidase [Syntrophomonadaceae bacterium]
MFKLLSGGHCFVPNDMGIKDMLVCADKICMIQDKIIPDSQWKIEVIDCSGCLICPGLIDGHVHITGGGGEQGPASRVPELGFSEIIEAGVTTVVGVLGFDSISRSIAGLLTKARGLEAEGITTFIYTGSYGSPTETLTGRPLNDIVLLDKVVGIGEIAISDYRSYHPTLSDLRNLASEAQAGGMLGDKAGILHLHVGDGKEGLQPLFELIEQSDFPTSMFVPTHINRNPQVFEQGMGFLPRGGNIDLTAGETAGYSIPEALSRLLRLRPHLERITISSDGNGSSPVSDKNPAGIAAIGQLLNDLRAAVLEAKLDFASVIKTVTVNPAQLLKLYPRKGCIQTGSDADLLVLRRDDLAIQTLLAKGEVVVRDQKSVKRGRFEN